MTGAGNLPRRVAAMEQRLGMGQQPAQIFVYRGFTETEDEAVVRHFDDKGPPPGAEVVFYALGPMLLRRSEQGGEG